MLTSKITNTLPNEQHDILCIGNANYNKTIKNIDNGQLQKLKKDHISFNRFDYNGHMTAIAYVDEKLFETSDRFVDHSTSEKHNITPDDIAHKISIFDRFEEYKSHKIAVLLPESDIELAKNIMKILILRRYRYTLSTKNPSLNSEILFITNNTELQDYHNHTLLGLTEAIFWARDLSNTPPNLLYPKTYAEQIVEKFKGIENVKVKVLDKTKILEEKMGALYGVAQGSHHEPYVVIIEYLNSNQDTAPIALVGKGVCFDTGGISLKPANNMWDMKHDMHGSATVVGTLLALAKNKTRTNTIGIVGLVENMPGGGAQRPGDIVTSRSGQTIEMLNSDAEGRLVLADIIDYVQDIYKPKQLINYATLTGAIVVALGHEYAGLWSNNFKFANTFVESSYSTLDKYWPMPLHDTFNKGMNSSVADIKNISSPGTGAGSCTAAHFIGRFIKNKTPWIHIDIAGTAFGCVNSYSLHNGGTGFGIASTYKFIIESN